MSRISQITLAALVAMIGLFLMAKLRYAGKARVRLPVENCNAGLWKHVYRPERLRVIEACTFVDGRVVTVHRESDGDLHIALDSEDKAVLNFVNAMHARGYLVVEVACEHAPDSGNAITACAGFTPKVTVPNVGDRVRVTGAYVTDRDNGWNEIHPVTSIETLR